MSSTEAIDDRRQHLRVPTHGAVVFWARGQEVRGRLASLSDVALDVRCNLGFALLGMAGAHVDLELVVEGSDARWRFAGQVRFVRAASHTLVIHYDTPIPDLARAIENHLTAHGDGVASTQLMLLARERERAAAERHEDPSPRRQEPS